jgi:hypothetical protein
LAGFGGRLRRAAGFFGEKRLPRRTPAPKPAKKRFGARQFAKKALKQGLSRCLFSQNPATLRLRRCPKQP